MGRYWVLSTAWAWLCICACSRGEPRALAEAPPEPVELEAKVSARPADVPKDQPGVQEPSNAYLNLQNLVHMADFERGGLFIDFGTPARPKYTVGEWKTGWGGDGMDGDISFTHVASSGRVYFPLRSSEALVIRLRLKPIGTGTLQLYLNNVGLRSIRLDQGPDYAEYDVKVPAEVARSGENNLLLRFGGVTQINGTEIAAAIDWLRVLPAATSRNAPPVLGYSELVQDVRIADQPRRAIVLPGGSALSYYVEVPKGGKLSLRAGALEPAKPEPDSPALRASVRVTAEGGKSRELYQATLGSHWQDELLPLESFAGAVVKLDLIASGAGSAAFSSPAIIVPRARAVRPKATAQSVIVLLIDTLRADRLRTYTKTSRVETPVLDKFAAQGAVMEAAQAPENWTKPSVASVLTGLYPISHGAKRSDARLSEDALLVSEVFKQNGFVTGAFLANGYVSDKFGFNQGWDAYTNYIRENKPSTAQRVFKDAGDWIEAHRDQRFFAYVHTIDPHVPYDPPAEFLKLYEDRYAGRIRPRDTPDLLEKAKRVPPAHSFDEPDRAHLEALYDGEISYHDRYLGQFIERLKKLGLYDQVVFVITSDHGEEFFDHGSYGHGHSVYQELLHVPFIVRWPGGIQPQRVASTVSTVDVTPTVLSATGIDLPEELEGTDRVPQLLGAMPVGPQVAFSDFLDDRRVIRAGRWKLILRGLTPTLFDLRDDPRELTELDPKQHPIALRYCRTLLGQFLGARDRGDWLSAAPQGKSVELRGEAAVMDEATKAGLRALGYAN